MGKIYDTYFFREMGSWVIAENKNGIKHVKILKIGKRYMTVI